MTPPLLIRPLLRRSTQAQGDIDTVSCFPQLSDFHQLLKYG
jgi:hypothetical protein